MATNNHLNPTNQNAHTSAQSDVIRQLFERVYRDHAAETVLNGETFTFTQLSAAWMYDVLQLNVFPQVIRSKSGIPWKALQYTRLHRNDKHYGLMACFSGLSNIVVMVGATSHNLFVLDCESVSTFEWVIEQLKARHIPVWAYRTGKGGHVWLRCADGVVKSVPLSASGLQLEVKGNTGYVLAPPSVHPSGALYDWSSREGETIPVVTLSQIDFLPFALELHTKARQNAPKRDLSVFWPTTQDYLAQGHLTPVGKRHEAFRWAACDYVRNGFGAAEIARDLIPIARRSGLPDADDPNYFDRIVTAVLRGITPQRHNTQKILDWQRAESFVARTEWRGRTGSTDRAVALALIERAKTYSNDNGTFRGSYREIAAIARISNRNTLAKALDRLKAVPFVTAAGVDANSGASLWRFSNKALQIGTTAQPVTRPIVTDALERGVIGQRGMQIWQAMLELDTPATASMIAEAAGVTKKQVYYALRADGWLITSELVKRVDSGWVAFPATGEQIDEVVAMPAGVLGRGQQRVNRFADERAIDAGRQIVLWRESHDRRNYSV